MGNIKNGPLVIETGESFITNGQVARYIREKCGDAIGDYVEEALVQDGKNQKDMYNRLEAILTSVEELESDIQIALGCFE